MASPNTQPIRQHAWRLAILLPAMLIALAGIQWLRMSQTTLYFGDLNPDGSAFVAVEREELGQITQTSVVIRDAGTGRVLADLSGFAWKGELKWSSDGRKLVGLVDGDQPGQSRIRVINALPPIRIVEDWEIADPQPLVVYFDKEDRVISLRVLPGIESNRPRLEIIANNSETVRTIEFGKNEQAHGFMSRDGQTVNIGFYPDAAAGPTGDYVFTDGQQQSLLRLDSLTGERICLVRGTVNTIYGISQLVSIHNPTKKQHEIFAVGDLTTPIASMPETDMPSVFLDDRRVLARDYGARTVTVYDLQSGAKRLLTQQRVEQMAPSTQGRVMVTVDRARVMYIDVDTGQSTELIDRRAGMKIYQALAVGGIPLLWASWMYLGIRFRSERPFLDMAVLCFTTTVIALLWSVFGVMEFFPGRGTVLFGFTILAASTLLSLIWASTLRSRWGIALPGAIVGAAVVLGILLIWTQGDSYRAFEGLLCGGATIFWQILGLAAFRRWYGVLTKSTEPSQDHVKQNQMTLRQALIATGAFALLFAFMQFIDFEKGNFPGSKILLVWLFTFTSVVAFASLAALWSAFRFPNRFASLVLYVIAASAFATLHFVLTQVLQVQVLWSVAVRYGLPVAAGLVVWLALRYCRALGYRLA